MEIIDDTYMSPTSIPATDFSNTYQSVEEDATYMAPKAHNTTNKSGLVDMSEFSRKVLDRQESLVFAQRPKSNVAVKPKTSPLLKPTHESHLSLRKHFFIEPDLPSKKGDASLKEDKNVEEMYVEATDATASPTFRSFEETKTKSPKAEVSRKKSIVIMKGETEPNSFISLEENDEGMVENEVAYQAPIIRHESVPEVLEANSSVYLDFRATGEGILENQTNEVSSQEHFDNIEMGGVISQSKKLGLRGKKNNDVTTNSLRPDGNKAPVRMRGSRTQNGNLKISGPSLPRPISMPFSSPPEPPAAEETLPNLSPPRPPPQGIKPQIYTQNIQANPGNRPLPPPPGKFTDSCNNLTPEHQNVNRVSSIPMDAPPLPPTVVPVVVEKPPPLLPKSDETYIPKLPYRPPSPYLKISEPESTSSSASSSPTRKMSTTQDISLRQLTNGLKPSNSQPKLPQGKYSNPPIKPPMDIRKPPLRPNSQREKISIESSPKKVHPIAEIIKKRQMEAESEKNQSPAKEIQRPPATTNQKLENKSTKTQSKTQSRPPPIIRSKNALTGHGVQSTKSPSEINKSPPLPFKPPIGTKPQPFKLPQVATFKDLNKDNLQEVVVQNQTPLQATTQKKDRPVRGAYSLHKLQAAKLSNSANSEMPKPESIDIENKEDNVADPNIYSSIDQENTEDAQSKVKAFPRLPKPLLTNIQNERLRKPLSPSMQGNSVTLDRKPAENIAPNSPGISNTMPRSPKVKTRPRPNVPPPPRPTVEPPKPPVTEKPRSPSIRSPQPTSPLIRSPPPPSPSIRSPPPSRPPPPSMINIQAAKLRQEVSRQEAEKKITSLQRSKSNITPIQFKPPLIKDKNKSMEINVNLESLQDETYQAIPDISSESNFSTCSEDSAQREAYSPKHLTKKKKKGLIGMSAFKTKLKRKPKQEELDESLTYMMAMDTQNNQTAAQENFEAMDECIYSGIDDGYTNSNNNSSIYLTSIPAKELQYTEYTYAELDHTLYDDVAY